MKQNYSVNTNNSRNHFGTPSRLSSLLLTLLLVAFCLFGVNENAWGQTYNNGTWYSYYDDQSHTMNTQGDWDTGSNVYAPTNGTLNVKWKYEWLTLAGSFRKIDTEVLESSNGGSNTTKIGSFQNNTDKNSKTTEKYTNLSANINWIKFNRTGAPTHKVIVYHIDIPMAQHIRLKSSSTTNNANIYGVETQTLSAFTNTPVEHISTDVSNTNYKQVQFRSFLTGSSGRITITSSNPEVFRVGSTTNTGPLVYNVGANMFAYESGSGACSAGHAGATSNYNFKIYFYPKKAQKYTGTITISDGTSTATVTVTGTGVLNENAITWNPNTLDKKNWGDQVDANATATNNESGCPAITYSVETGKGSYVTLADGKFTFNQAGAGQTVTITASQAENYKYKAASQSRTFTIKAGQTIVWDPDKVDTNIRILKSRDINGYAYGTNPSNAGTSRTISYSSADQTKISISGTTITANSLGDVDIIATLYGDADYNVVTSNKTFTVKDKETVEYYLGGNLIAEDDVLNFKVGESSAVITSKNKEKEIAYTSSNGDVAIFNTTTQKIDAIGAGSTTITLSQKATDDYLAGARSIVVNVTLNTTTITTNVSEMTMEVGDEYDPVLNTTNSEVQMTITTKKSGVVAYENGKLKALGAGKDTITFTQAKTTKWAKGEKSIIVTVNKKEPTITITGVPATAWNTTIEPTISSTNKDPNCAISIEKRSGADAAARLINNTIHVYDKNGETVTFRVSQEGNDTCVKVHQDFSFTVQKSSNHVTFTYSGTGNMSPKKGNESDIIEFEGVPLNITCNLSSNASADKYYYVLEADSKDGQFNPVGGDHKNGSSISESLSPSTRAIKFKFDGAWNMLDSKTGTFSNITVNERKEIVVKGLTSGYYDFGTWEVGNQATDRAIPIKWYSVPKTTVTSSNPGVFDVITETINSEIDDFSESASVVIRYHHKRVTSGTQDEATITLTSENGYTKTFKVKGKTIKKDQTLIWQDELTPIEVGTVIPNAAIAPLALNYTITSTTEEGVVELDGTVLKAKKVGTVTLHVENDGDAMWNPISGECTIKVTNLKVQHIRWNQTFTRLTTSDADVPLIASAYEYVNGEEVAITARSISYTSSNTNVVTVVNGKLHVVGVGTTTLTASLVGVTGEYEPASVTRKVKVRVKSTGCVPYAIENESADIKTHIYDFTGSEKVYSLNGVEPNQVTFEAWREDIMGFTDGKVFVAESTDNGSSWTELQGYSINEGEENATTCGPKSLSREATHIKIYKKTGATGYHNFKNLDVTKAKYLELDDTKNKTTMDISFPAEETHLGQTYIKSVVVNYSNIYDMLYVNHTNPNFRITPTEIGEGCGENSRATITIIYYAKEAINESDVITITDEHGLTATINVSASVSKSDQTITWNPATEINTTDEVTFDATASSELAVSYALAEGDADVATLTEDGHLTIKTEGDIHVTASQAGSGLYNSVELEPVTIHISKVTPSVSVKPSVDAVTLPKTLSDITLNVTNAKMLNDKGAEVAGTYAWVDGTTVVTDGSHDYPVRFTPTKTAWYTEKEFDVTVTASKRDQTISWNFADAQTLPCSAEVPLNATIKDAFNNEPMDVELTYTSNNESCAVIGDGKLNVKAPGTVTITVSRDEDETYNAASISRTITFVKATPVIDILPTANAIYEGQMLSQSAITGGYVRSGNRKVEGYFIWTTEDFEAAIIGTQNYNIQFIPSNEACYNRVNAEIPMQILQIARVFNNTTGDGDWENPANWSNGFVPPVNTGVDVTVAEDVTITDNANVHSITITDDVTITVSGNLTLTGTIQSENNKYANVVVKDGGSLTTSNTITINNFSIEASQGTSGQVMNPEKLDIRGEAYIDITISTNSTLDEDQWYGFTVPFPVNATTGVERILDNGTVQSGIVWNDNYVIASYDSQRRASGSKGWRAFSGVMTPGVFYLLGIDNQARVYRFHKTSTGDMVAADEMALRSYPATGSGDSGDANWNAVGNPALRYSHASCPVDFVQIYDNNTGAYEPAYTATSTFVVGRPFFIQTGGGTLSISAADGTHSEYYAPRRTQANEVRPIGVLLEADSEINDRVFVRASEDATGDYVIGRDLQKLGTTTKKAQMWINALGKQLCVREETLNNDEANYDLSIYAPENGSYSLSIDEALAPEDAALYLTYNGTVIWDLTTSPYVLDLTKGTTMGYGLRLGAANAPQITTGVENAETEGQTMRKVIIDNRVYIVTPEGKMYDIIGKSVK